MWISQRFRPIADIDIRALAEVLARTPEAEWEVDEALRQTVTGGRETKAIFFRSILTPDFVQAIRERPLVDGDVTRYHDTGELRDVVQGVIDQVLAHFPAGGVVTRVQLARMQPGARIEPHVDSSPQLTAAHRLHVPVTTNDDVRFIVDGERVRMEAAKLYELNNRLEHAVYNDGTQPRTHLIIDYLPPQHNHRSSLSPSFERRRKQLAADAVTPRPAIRSDVSLPRVVATSVIRGAHQNESHGGVYLVDLETGAVEQVVDWNTCNIEWEGRGADRGLRGIAFDGDDIYIAASDELFCFNKKFEVVASYRNHYLKHAHEIVRWQDQLFVTSTGFDSVLRFDLRRKAFDRGWIVRQHPQRGLIYAKFDPHVTTGPRPGNTGHLNSVYCDERGIFVAGRNFLSVLHIGGPSLGQFGELPPGTHNAQPCGGGLLFNDTHADLVVYQSKKDFVSVPVPTYPEHELLSREKGDDKLARQAFGRGLCRFGDDLVIAGSSPSTISAIDLRAGAVIKSVNLTMDIRNAIHGLEVWPY